MHTIKDYVVQVYLDNHAEYFVAEIHSIRTCAADGATQAEALANLEETFAVLKEAYCEEGVVIPTPTSPRSISVEQLSELSNLVKISCLAELAGIPGQTLATKLKRGTPFSVAEARKISRALHAQGLAMC